MVIVAGYLTVGTLMLCLLELRTKRISSRLKPASLDIQQITGGSSKMALVVTVLALLVLWPFAIYAAVRG